MLCFSRVLVTLARPSTNNQVVQEETKTWKGQKKDTEQEKKGDKSLKERN